MAAYDVELLSLPRHVATADVAAALSLGFDETATMLGRLPAMVAQSIDELDAEALFHGLRDLGAEVRLNPVAGPPSQRPSARPGPTPFGGPSAPPAPGPMSSRPPQSSHPAVEPIDLPGLDDDPFELELDERASGSLRPPPGPSQPPGALSLADTLAPLSDMPPRSRPPSGPAGPMSSRPPPSGPSSSRPGFPVPTEEPLGEARGSFIGAVPGAYAYAFNPGVMLQAVLTALVAWGVNTLSFGIFAFIGFLLAMGIVSVLLFAIIQRGTMGKPGPPAPAEGNTDDLFASVIRVVLAIVVPLWLLAFLAARTIEAGALLGVLTSPAMRAPVVLIAGALWLLYLPSSLILAAHGTGCLGGLNILAGVKLIVRAPIGYGLLWISLLPVGGLLIGTTILGGIAIAALPFGGGLVMLILCMFPLAMGARLLGLYIYHYEYELGLA